MQRTRTDFDDRLLAAKEQGLLEAAGNGNGVALILQTERDVMEKLLQDVVEGNTLQINNLAFVNEL